MKKNLLIVIGIWSLCLTAWTLAGPPSGTIGVSKGRIAADSAGNIGIGTETPATLLDVNGTTTIRKTLDMSGNRIWNVATPTSSLDAANKAYVDAALASVTSSTTRLWSEGRPGADLVAGTHCGNTAECYRDLNGSGACNVGDIKISRSSRSASWDGAAAACPRGSWVCTAAEYAATACGTGTRAGVYCEIPASTNNEIYAITTNIGWLADVGTTNDREFGRMARVTGAVEQEYICGLFPVWCCANQ